MKRTIQSIIVTASFLTGGIALAQAPSSATAGSPPPGQMKKADKAMGGDFQGFMAPKDEKSLLEHLHYANQQEIKLGQLAEKNAMSPEVKSFASMMVKDHTAMDQKLMDYAKGKNMKVADMPKPANDTEKKMMAQDKATMEELQRLKGAAFDSCYMAGQVGDHDATLGKVLAAKQTMTTMDPTMTSMVQELTTKVPQHREQAWTILGKLDDTMATGGSGATMGGTMGGSTGGTMDHGAMGHGSTTGGSTAPTTPAPKK
jgi:putative membrane protein